jgi:hypothetical protein
MMQMVTIEQIDERLKKLPAGKLLVVYDFVSYLSERVIEQGILNTLSEAFQTMLVSEAVLARDWNLPEEDLAWADL